ncbi:apolipoprotein A-IV-like [Oncorhynchus clarkii lewisi]|uniref:apolipoprotein A-IV-like n=1 Tax=Oncorhynchus clarkii lewisi TaxID=490388 RepID=UPI0039B8561A
MHLKVVIFALSFLTTTAYPLHRTSRETSQALRDMMTNQAHEKTDLNKDVNGLWKSHVENSNLYFQDSANPMVSEIRHKLTLESERLRARLRQELTKLREMLAPYPAHPQSSESTLASMRDRLGPLIKQLQSALDGNSQELCSHLRLYFQGLEAAERQAVAGPILYLEAVQWISQTLDDSSAEMTFLIQDFKTKTSSMIRELNGTIQGDFWQEVNVRLGQEVQALSLEVQGRVGVLKAKLAHLLLAPQPLKAVVSTSMEQFCQSVALQDQLFHARIEKHLLGQESKAQTPSEPLSLQPLGLLEEDFSAKLSALLQDILHNVQ